MHDTGTFHARTAVCGCIEGAAQCSFSIDHKAIVKLPIRAVILCLVGKLQL